MTSEDNNPAIQETNRVKLSVVIVEDHIPMKEVVNPAPLSSKAATIVESLDTMQSRVESHAQTSSHGQNRGQGRGRSSNRGHGRPSRVHNQLHNLDVTEVDNHEDDYLYTVDTEKTKNSKPMFLVQLNGVPTKMLGDSGASVNVIDEPTLETLAPKPDMQPPDMNLYAYGSKEKALPLLGMFVGTIATEQFTHTTKVYVAQGSYGTLMSRHTAEKLNLIKINKKAVIANPVTSSNAESIAYEFAERFKGLVKCFKATRYV